MEVNVTITKNSRIAIAADHGGYHLKEALKRHLAEEGYANVTDFGTNSAESCDYPDFGYPACKSVTEGKCDCAILVCGTGIGMSLVANKVHGIRAACCSDTFSARFTRLHNDANVLCIGARVVGEGLAVDIVDLFLTSDFEGGKHQRRIDKIAEIEQNEK